MFELLKKRIKNEKGLSLVELLAVIVILGIVAAIAIPAIGNIIENSRYNAVKADGINVINAANLYFVDNPGAADVTVKQLLDSTFLDTPGKIPSAGKVTKGTAGSTAGTQNALTTAAIKYSGDKTVTFNGATISGINADDKKGSGSGNYTIGTAPAPSNP
ncbi:prepilin-type N-terminal cleavage/methylation domain-containing protein [Solibacillus sp. FSL W7-1472]|uniref:prepilin-type N-terminal cleavage/methylation domain-containing protein n=1 Tax=Solibacillus sp. FSL W7-1472 TaxID=2921707 RepID=UPI0030DD6283